MSKDYTSIHGFTEYLLRGQKATSVPAPWGGRAKSQRTQTHMMSQCVRPPIQGTALGDQ